MKLKGIEERRAARLSGREKVDWRPSVTRKIPTVKMPPPPPIPIAEREAEQMALTLLRKIVLGSDSQLDSALEAARKLLDRPIVPPTHPYQSGNWSVGGKPVVSVIVSNEYGVITQVAIHHARLAGPGLRGRDHRARDGRGYCH